MTGFGTAEGDCGGRRVRIEIRTVNHRWFNLSIRMPAELVMLEAEVRDALRRDFERGHVSVSVRWTEARVATPAEAIDWPKVEAAVQALRLVQDRLGLGGEVSLDLVVRQTDLLRTPIDEPLQSGTWAELAPTVQAAATACRATRQREGNVLTADLVARLDALDAGSSRIAERAPGRLLHERDRLRGNVALLLDGRAMDEGRLSQEVAVAADRLDIAEELVRLRAHVAAAAFALAGTGAVGKQLGFLAQELGREVNTVGSKANDAAIAHEVVAMKGELEKFREQLENVE